MLVYFDKLDFNVYNTIIYYLFYKEQKIIYYLST